MRTFILGLDIGGTNIRIGAVDEKGGVLCFEKVPRTSVLRALGHRGEAPSRIRVPPHQIKSKITDYSVAPSNKQRARCAK